MADLLRPTKPTARIYQFPDPLNGWPIGRSSALDPTILSLLEAIPSRVAVFDEHLQLVAANEAWQSARRRNKRSRSARSLEDHFAAECREADLHTLRYGLEQVALGLEDHYACRYASRAKRHQIVSVYAARFQADVPLLLVALRDRNAKSRKEAASRQQQLAILLAEEEERRRIARELHDETSQQLTLIQFGVEGLKRAHCSPEADQACQAIETALTAVQHQVRTLSYVLHPPELCNGGLGIALGSFTKGFGRRTGLDVEFYYEEASSRCSEEIEIALYRVAQEALTNVLKHSGADAIMVRLFDGLDEQVLEISDNGVGIPVSIASGQNSQAMGVGLSSMRERIEALSGRFTINRLEPGTMIRATVPRQSQGDY